MKTRIHQISFLFVVLCALVAFSEYVGMTNVSSANTQSVEVNRMSNDNGEEEEFWLMLPMVIKPGNQIETPVASPTSTSVPTNTPTATSTSVPTNTPTAISTSVPTNTPTAISTSVPTNTPIPAGTPTNTPIPGNTSHTLVASGNWSDPAVWQNGTLPTHGGQIVIPSGLILTVDSVIAPAFKRITIDGTLRFATDVNTELRVDTMMGNQNSRLEIGTTSNPIAANVTARIIFADFGPIDRNEDPEQLSRGAVLHGQTEIYGAERTHRVTLATHPRAGDSILQFNSVPTGWRVGDEIVVTGTQGATSDELRTIASINGSTITLNQPLQLDHVAPRSDLNVYVANTTRNVRLESENPEIAHRGHLMFMHTLDLNINYAGFYQLGRTDKSRPLDDLYFDFDGELVGNGSSAPVIFTVTEGPRTNIRGRYALHIHRGGTDLNSMPAVVKGSVVFNSPGWGFVNHSSNANFIDNVSYAVQGAGFYTESGDEIGSMVGNIAIRSVNPTFQLDDGEAIDPDLGAEQQDFGNVGDGYWLSGHLVSMINNVSAGSSAHGIIIWSDGLVEADRGRATVRVADLPNGHLITGRETVPVWWAPLAEIRNNEAYGSVIGFRSRYVHAAGYLADPGSEFHTPPPQAYIDTLNPVIDGVTVWGSRDGILLNYNERLTLQNARAVGIGAPFNHNLFATAAVGVGLDLTNEETRGPGAVTNVTIEGFEMGFIAPRHDTWTISNLTLSNVTDILIHEVRQGPRTMTMSNFTFGSLDGTAVAGRDSERRNIVMDPSFEFVGFQPYFFVMPDRITLDGQGVYFDEQRADFIPLPEPPTDEEADLIDPAYVGQTNQQLNDTFGLSFGGALLPNDAQTVSFVTNGVVGTAAPPPTVFPPMLPGEEDPGDDGGEEEDPGDDGGQERRFTADGEDEEDEFGDEEDE